MSKELVEEILAHHGTKGMKWGVRNDRGHEGEKAKTKKIVKLDKKFARDRNSPNTYIKIHNAAAVAANKEDIDRINNKPEWVKAANEGKLLDARSPEYQKYAQEHVDAFLKQVQKAANDLGTNASGTQKYAIQVNSDTSWNVVLSDVKHAAAPNDVLFTVQIQKDKNGRITQIVPSSKVTHADIGEAFLEHHGIKGMKWGSRKSGESSVAARGRAAVAKIQLKPHHKEAGKQYVQNVLKQTGHTYVKALTGAAAQKAAQATLKTVMK